VSTSPEALVGEVLQWLAIVEQLAAAISRLQVKANNKEPQHLNHRNTKSV
jgi:hypothetical protein